MLCPLKCVLQCSGILYATLRENTPNTTGCFYPSCLRSHVKCSPLPSPYSQQQVSVNRMSMGKEGKDRKLNNWLKFQNIYIFESVGGCSGTKGSRCRWTEAIQWLGWRMFHHIKLTVCYKMKETKTCHFLSRYGRTELWSTAFFSSYLSQAPTAYLENVFSWKVWYAFFIPTAFVLKYVQFSMKECSCKSSPSSYNSSVQFCGAEVQSPL